VDKAIHLKREARRSQEGRRTKKGGEPREKGGDASEASEAENNKDLGRVEWRNFGKRQRLRKKPWKERGKGSRSHTAKARSDLQESL
jgi:hypothetical protein